MKPYTEAPYCSMDVKPDAALHQALVSLFKANPPSYFIETGTYLGTGSTTIFADAIIESGMPTPKDFYTFESNKTHWEWAKFNLRKFPFVTPVFGRTVTLAETRAFLDSDPVFNNQDAYPDIYIDPGVDYFDETKGHDGSHKKWAGEGLLNLYLNAFKDNGLGFICLDSAGGIGWLEFQIVERTLKDKDYYIFCDDVEHIKAFRSAKFMNSRPDEFKLHITKNGWGLWTHKANDHISTPTGGGGWLP